MGGWIFCTHISYNRLHPDIRCAPTLFKKGSQVETIEVLASTT